MTEEPLGIDRAAGLKAAFTASDLPFRVDIVDWASTSEAFRKVIGAEYVVLDSKGGSSSADWVRLTLADACSAIDYGLTASASNERSGPRFLRITDIVSEQIDWNSVPYVAAADSTAEKYRLHDGDIVVARTGASTGASAYIKNPPRAVFASYLVRLRAKPDFSARFLAYVLKSEEFWEYIRGVLGDKSAQPNASASTMTAAPIRVPRDKAEQCEIAHILGTLDDKIELNRRMSATLEATARALFKSWFVDFDPVRAKMEGRDTGLPKDVADLFPDRFEGSELGDAPRGWAVASIGEVTEVIDCLHSKKPRRTTEGKPLLQLWNIRDDGLVDLSDTYFIDEADYERWTSRIELRVGDCVITNVGRVGAVSQVPPGLNAALGRNMTGIRCRTGFRYPTFTIELLLSDAMRWEIALRTDSGTILNALNVRSIPRLRFMRAPEPVLEAYERIARPTRARMEANLEASRTLTALRDALLPKLVSGALRVNFLESAVDPDSRTTPAGTHGA